MILNILSGINNMQGEAEILVVNVGILAPYLKILPKLLLESIVTLLPLSILFLLFNYARFKLSKKRIKY